MMYAQLNSLYYKEMMRRRLEESVIILNNFWSAVSILS